MSNTPTPVPVLSAKTLYKAYDRFVCKECAGMTAEYTGVTIGGYRLTVITAADVIEWTEYDLGPMTCECRRLEAVLDDEQHLQIRPGTPQLRPNDDAPTASAVAPASSAPAEIRCQCEHIDHETPATSHPYLGASAGTRRAQHVGPICDECATRHLADYLLEDPTEEDRAR